LISKEYQWSLQKRKIMILPLISVIIPIYQVEKYIKTCIDSIIHQTYFNLEIILVDDGSLDNCGTICDNYLSQDSRIKVIHKKNGGLSDARNVAIDIANGEYITFIDSDDFVSPNHINTLYSLICKYRVTLSISQFKNYKEGDDLYIRQPIEREIYLDFQNAIKTMLYQRKFETSAWGKLYKSDLFDNGIRYPKGLLYEDLPTTYKLIQKANYVAVTNQITYYYLLRNNSIIGNTFNIKKKDILEVGNMMKDHFQKELPVLLNPLKCRLLSSYLNVYMQIERKTPIEKIFWKRIKEFRKTVLLDNQARAKARIACLLSYCGQDILRFCFYFINRRK